MLCYDHTISQQLCPLKHMQIFTMKFFPSVFFTHFIKQSKSCLLKMPLYIKKYCHQQQRNTSTYVDCQLQKSPCVLYIPSP